MNDNFIGIPPSVTQQLQENHKKRELLIDATKIQLDSTAEQVAKYIYNEVINYQQNLPDQNDVALRIVQFNQSTIILVDSIGYIGYNLVKFVGKDNLGNPLELIQHISQLNFLLMVEQKPVPTAPKRQIGFEN